MYNMCDIYVSIYNMYNIFKGLYGEVYAMVLAKEFDLYWRVMEAESKKLLHVK